MNQQPKSKSLNPVLFSLPVAERLKLPSRAELLPKIESGEIDHLDFRANVFSPAALNVNPYRFKDEDMENFAVSFEGQPYLRDHCTYAIDARDGTIVSAAFMDEWIQVDVRLTTRRGMIDYLEGKMDRFSIGWFYDDASCSICGNSFFSSDCSHWPGVKYKVGNETKTCVLTFINPRGKEVSAVNVPAVQGTSITGALAEAKLSLLEGEVFEETINPSMEISSLSETDKEIEREAQALRVRVTNILEKEKQNV
jgi:hypothetical protein